VAALASLVIAACAALATNSSGATGDPPTIVGTAVQGSTLVAQDPAGTPYALHQWQRCQTAGGTCSAWDTVAGPHATSYTLGAADVGHLIRVRGKDTNLGSQWASSTPVGPVAAPGGGGTTTTTTTSTGSTTTSTGSTTPGSTTPTGSTTTTATTTTTGPAGPATLPPAEANETANLFGIDGSVYVRVPGGALHLVTDPEQVPLGSVIDVRNGVVGVVTAKNAGGAQQSVEFWDGIFVITQLKAKGLLTNAELVGPGKLGDGAARLQVAERGKGRRGLWGRGRCKCRTEGNHSAGTVKGTWWFTGDRKRRTTTKVKKGVVEVKNFASGEKVKVRAGERYVAHAGD
jgi:hypothetical protein